MEAPLQFEPYFRPLVWGGRRLATLLGKPLPSAEPFGEAWEVSDHATHRSRVVGGPFAGRSLRELMTDHRQELLGAAASGDDTFPWLLKLIDAQDWLSVQVHPDDAQAAELWPGERGKTEAWYILDALPGSRVYAGLHAGVAESDLRAALAAGRVADCLYQFEPRPGDALFLPAGTVHAVGGGVLMAEIQQTSDATFRLYDWDRRDAQGRSRPLHVEQALRCIDWARGPVPPVRAAGHPAAFAGAAAPGAATQRLAQCRYFDLDYVRREAPFALGGAGRLQAILTVHGAGRVYHRTGEQRLLPGQALVIPASAPVLCCVPDESLGLLLASLPC